MGAVKGAAGPAHGIPFRWRTGSRRVRVRPFFLNRRGFHANALLDRAAFASLESSRSSAPQELLLAQPLGGEVGVVAEREFRLIEKRRSAELWQDLLEVLESAGDHRTSRQVGLCRRRAEPVSDPLDQRDDIAGMGFDVLAGNVPSSRGMLKRGRAFTGSSSVREMS